MAEPGTVALIVTSALSTMAAAGGLWRGMRADRNAAEANERSAAQQSKSAEIVALQQIVATLQDDGRRQREENHQLRTELHTERLERAAAEDRLRSEIGEIRAARFESEAARRVLTNENTALQNRNQSLIQELDACRGSSSNGR